MKRIGYLYEKIYDMDNLRLAHQNAKKGKGWYKEVQDVDNNLDYYLTKLQSLLIDQQYHTSKYEVFTVWDDTKYRDIYKLPYFPDRICQWAILQVIQPYLLRVMTTHTYSAIPGRGIHQALKHIRRDMKSDPTGTKYCLKLDISKYYPSIDQQVLITQLRRLFKDEKLMQLLIEIIRSTESGLPIGNYLSQWFGNFYLSSLAHYIKEQLHIKYLYIYMDDIVMLSDSEHKLHSAFLNLREYLSTHLKLSVKSNYQIYDVDTRGLDFVGYRIYHSRVILRRSTYLRLRSKMTRLNHKPVLSYSDYCSINSYLGWLRYCTSDGLVRRYITPLSTKMQYYYDTYIRNKEMISI